MSQKKDRTFLFDFSSKCLLFRIQICFMFHIKTKLLPLGNDDVGYIQKNKNKLKYTLNYSTQHHSGNYNAEKAIAYNNYDRFSTENLDENAFWSICLEKLVYILYYKFQEPEYYVSEDNSHQKTWIFYGSNNNKDWIKLDKKENMAAHNEANYIGKYPTQINQYFRCFKLRSLENWGENVKYGLTFKNFDIFINGIYQTKHKKMRLPVFSELISIVLCK